MADRSRLCEAAQEGKLDVVKKLIAKRVPLDGSDCEKYKDVVDGCVKGAPYAFPLGEAARFGHVEVVKALLAAGAPVDTVNYTNETALIQAASWGQLETFELLRAAGANIEHVGCLGTALRVLQPGYHEHAVTIAKSLLDNGASPLTTAPWTKPPVDKFLDRIKSNDVEKKHLRHVRDLLEVMLPKAGKRAADLEAAIGKLNKKLGVSAAAAKKSGNALADLAQAKTKTWGLDLRKVIGPITEEKHRTMIEQVIKVVLPAPTAVKHALWPAVVRDMIALSRNYGDASKATYGKRLSVLQIENDEGSAMDWFADEHLYTWDWVLEMLAQPAPLAHPSWARLVMDVCEHKYTSVRTYSFGDEQISALLEVPAAKGNMLYAQVVAAARKAFPYAPCFGAKGSLRDFDVKAESKGAPRKAKPVGVKTAPKKAAPKKAVASKPKRKR